MSIRHALSPDIGEAILLQFCRCCAAEQTIFRRGDGIMLLGCCLPQEAARASARVTARQHTISKHFHCLRFYLLLRDMLPMPPGYGLLKMAGGVIDVDTMVPPIGAITGRFTGRRQAPAFPADLHVLPR